MFGAEPFTWFPTHRNWPDAISKRQRGSMQRTVMLSLVAERHECVWASTARPSLTLRTQSRWVLRQVLRLYQAARIYARAAAVTRAEVRKKGRDIVILADRYQDRGTVLLRDALRKLPNNEREAFSHNVVQKDTDPAMNTLHRASVGRHGRPSTLKVVSCQWIDDPSGSCVIGRWPLTADRFSASEHP